MEIVSKDTFRTQGDTAKVVWVEYDGTALKRISAAGKVFWRANDGSPGRVRGGRSKEELEERYREAL